MGAADTQGLGRGFSEEVTLWTLTTEAERRAVCSRRTDDRRTGSHCWSAVVQVQGVGMGRKDGNYNNNDNSKKHQTTAIIS